MNRFIQWTSLFLLLISFQTVSAQSASLTLAQQQEEFTIFRGGLEEGHNGLYYFISRQAFARQCDSVRKTFIKGASIDVFYLKLRYLSALLCHGHTRVNLPGGQPVNFYMAVLKPDRLYLSLQLILINNSLYVLQDCSAEQKVKRGAEIIRINGKQVKALLDTMRRYLSADGRNQTFKQYQLYNYYYFHFLYNLLYPTETAFDVIMAGNKTPLRIAGQTPAAMARNYEAKTGKPIGHFEKQLAYNSMMAPATAYLKVGSFYRGFIESQGQRYEPFLDSVFKDLQQRGAKNLILDIRNNEGGGDGYNQLLFAYLGGKPLHVAGDSRVASRKFAYTNYLVDVSDEAKAFLANPSAFLIDSSLVLKPEFQNSDLPLQLTAPVFKGRLYVLMNGGTFSAANNLVSDLYFHRNSTGRAVVFIGEENGGDVYSGVLCAGQSFKIQLPHSGIQIDMPFLCNGELNTVYPTKRLPDFIVSNSIQDVMQERDAVVEFAIKKFK